MPLAPGWADAAELPVATQRGGEDLLGLGRLGVGLVARLVRYGRGYNPLGRPSPADLTRLADAMAAAGRDMGELELVGGTRAVFPDDRSRADLARALDTIPVQQAEGFTTFCINPSQFIDDPDGVGPFCAEVMRRVAALQP